MLRKHYHSQKGKGFTLIELSLVIAVILILVSVSTVSITAYRNWTQGLEAGETIKSVHQAQRLYLADNPTTNIANLTAQNIIDYLPNGATALPTITDLDGTERAINYLVSPPVIGPPDAAQTTSTYDPSSSTNDGVWDVGR